MVHVSGINGMAWVSSEMASLNDDILNGHEVDNQWDLELTNLLEYIKYFPLTIISQTFCGLAIKNCFQ